ncbi:hypothetical protein PGT21_026963 [Puccinia graminis f. sp. tritici]|uniref:Uncharacterized protein n=1 Tax=Puccinia graminis f. sp. tritici TaxID=56615 RepID=A0A5B0N9F1_PUCGR|nr:hypothetical protein PGT21_026963 [Puccinia graminis f. sp. tritici]
MYMSPTQNQLRPEITNLNLDTSPPHHRRVIVWSPLTIGIFPLIVSGSPIKMDATYPLNSSSARYNAMNNTVDSKLPNQEQEIDRLD